MFFKRFDFVGWNLVGNVMYLGDVEVVICELFDVLSCELIFSICVVGVGEKVSVFGNCD